MPLNEGQQGTLNASHSAGDLNALRFLALSVMSKMETVTLVEVISCSNSGGVSPVGTVTVKPMVNQLDGQNRPVDQPTLYEVPYFRLQGGTNAIIIDPEPGDIGIAAFASRDISSVKANKSQSNPGSARKYDLGDALYFGGTLNAEPEQYIQFSSSGIAIYSPALVSVTAPQAIVTADVVTVESDTVTVNATTSITFTSPISTFNGPVAINGTLTVTGLISGAGGLAIVGGSGAVVTGNISSTGSIEAGTSLTVNGVEVLGHSHSNPEGGNVGPME